MHSKVSGSRVGGFHLDYHSGGYAEWTELGLHSQWHTSDDQRNAVTCLEHRADERRHRECDREAGRYRKL